MSERPPVQEPADPDAPTPEEKREVPEAPSLQDLYHREEDPAALGQEDDALWDDDDLPSWA